LQSECRPIGGTEENQVDVVCKAVQQNSNKTLFNHLKQSREAVKNVVSWRRGIEPVIAAVILIAVAVVVAVAVVGWILGIWQSLLGGTPQINIANAMMCESYTDANTNKTYALVAVYIDNRGSGSDRIMNVILEYGGNVFKGVIFDYDTVNQLSNDEQKRISTYILPSGEQLSNLSKYVIDLGGNNDTVPGNKRGWLIIRFDLTGSNIKISAGDSAFLRFTFEKYGERGVTVTARVCPTLQQQ